MIYMACLLCWSIQRFVSAHGCLEIFETDIDFIKGHNWIFLSVFYTLNDNNGFGGFFSSLILKTKTKNYVFQWSSKKDCDELAMEKFFINMSIYKGCDFFVKIINQWTFLKKKFLKKTHLQTEYYFIWFYEFYVGDNFYKK